MANAQKDQNWTPTLLAVNASTGEPIEVEADNDGKLLVSSSAGGTLVTESFDYVSAAYPDAVTEVYTYKSGGSGGTTVATVTVVYTNSTKDAVSSVTKT